MRTFLLLTFIAFLLLVGCTNEEGKRLPNKTPKTFFWITPDSTILEGNSRQRLHWWGEDPDGIVKGYLFAIGKFLDSTRTIGAPDTISWHFTTKTDSIIAFPLVTKRDTFDVVIRAIDNNFSIPALSSTDSTFENAQIILASTPFWDKNGDKVYNSGDVQLPALNDAMDPIGATQAMPLRNQPPNIYFALDPNTQTDVFQQPDTTLTAITFSWYGEDPDGDLTIAKYIVALNDTTLSANKLTLDSKIKLITLVVPRSISDTATGTVTADVYKGTYSSPPTKIGTIGGLKLNSLNKFYVQAVDVAADSSHYIGMPSGTKKWYVKKPSGKLLIISDYASSDSNNVITFYRNLFPQVGSGQFANFEVLNLSKGMSLDDKKNHKVGRNVPPFFDPALIFTLHLFDVVYCYTDFYPSLYVVQIPLYEYIHNTTNPGKVIYSYSMPFDTTADASRALEDFAPIDSVSRVDLISPGLLYPLPGTNQVIGGTNAYSVYSDSSTTEYYPDLKFNSDRATHLIYVRQVFKRSDSRYIYHMQNDIRNPKRYATGLTLSELRSVSAVGSNVWACGASGSVFHSANNGVDWETQTSNVGYTLNSVQFLDANNGWIVGNVGTVLQTTNAGASWNDRSMVTVANFNTGHFVNASNGYIVGTYGTVIKTSNGGTGWTTLNTSTQHHLNGVKFLTPDVGIVVGDSIGLSTSDGGQTWQSIAGFGTRRYYSIAFSNSSTAYAVGARGTALKLVTTDNGATWTSSLLSPTLGTNSDVRSIMFTDSLNGWISCNGGTVFKTTNGGIIWSVFASNATKVTQNLGSIAFSDANQGWSVGTSGVILHTNNAGTTWDTQPPGVINVGVIDGQKSFVFLGLPLHLLNGNANVKNFIEHVFFQEFGLP